MRVKFQVFGSSVIPRPSGGACFRWPTIIVLLVLSLVIAGCGTATPEPTPPAMVPSQVSPLPASGVQPTPSAEAPSQVSPLPTPAVQPTPSAEAPSQVSPLPTPTSELAPALGTAPFQLVLLHTNDNWGETEPCG
jgi:predicted small lipoprotein YifL